MNNEIREKFSKILDNIILKIPVEHTVNAGLIYLVSEVSKWSVEEKFLFRINIRFGQYDK